MAKSRIVGIDYGLARIGLAISDESQMIASSVPFLKAKQVKENVDLILDTIKDLNVSEIVIGYPLKMNGSAGTLAPEIDSFIENLRAKSSLSVVKWDERFSTVQAERVMKEAHMNRKKRAKFVDSLSAVIILQNYLDYLHLRKIIS